MRTGIAFAMLREKNTSVAHISQAKLMLNQLDESLPEPKPSTAAVRAYLSEAEFAALSDDFNAAVAALEKAVRSFDVKVGRLRRQLRLPQSNRARNA